MGVINLGLTAVIMLCVFVIFYDAVPGWVRAMNNEL